MIKYSISRVIKSFEGWDMNNQAQSVSDDQELAKALAGASQDVDMTSSQGNSITVQSFDEPVTQDSLSSTLPMPDPTQSFSIPTVPSPLGDNSVASDSDLAGIKDAALSELRPLIDKLDVEPEEKFNTILLLIRSTDDKSLISSAHEAARQITDEAKKAQALLDIIKEIDYLSAPKQ